MSTPELSLLLSMIQGLRPDIWFLDAQFLTLVMGLVGVAWQVRRNGNSKK